MDGGKNLYSKKKKIRCSICKEGDLPILVRYLMQYLHSIRDFNGLQSVASHSCKILQAIKTALSQYLPNNFSKKVLL